MADPADASTALRLAWQRHARRKLRICWYCRRQAYGVRVMSSAGNMVERARIDAEALLADLPSRLEHTRAVAARAASLPLRPEEALTLVAAAWLHDVGYAPSIAGTGFHPLDGARWLREQAWGDEVVSLVAYHSEAVREAAVRGLEDELAEVAEPCRKLLDLLTWADMTTGPDGAVVRVRERLREILQRYDEDDPVSVAVSQSASSLMQTVERIESAYLQP